MGYGRVLLGAENQAHGWVLVSVRPMFAGIIQVQVHLAGIGVSKFPKLQVFGGAWCYVALGSSAIDFRMAHDGKRHITGPSSFTNLLHFATTGDLSGSLQDSSLLTTN